MTCSALATGNANGLTIRAAAAAAAKILKSQQITESHCHSLQCIVIAAACLLNDAPPPSEECQGGRTLCPVQLA